MQYVPALALAEGAPLMLGGVGIVWMHLDGKVLCSVKELDEQRESVSLRCAKELVVLRP